jgi:hypothetical protein
MPRRAPKRHRATTEWRPVRGRERPLRYLCRMSETRHVGDTPDVRHPSGRSSVSQRSPVLITRAPAPDRCQLQDRTCSVKAAFARTSARPFYRCDCLAVTDGLDGFRRPRTIRQREQGRHSPRLIPVTVVCQAAPGFMLFAPADRRWRRYGGSASGSEGGRRERPRRLAGSNDRDPRLVITDNLRGIAKPRGSFAIRRRPGSSRPAQELKILNGGDYKRV